MPISSEALSISLRGLATVFLVLGLLLVWIQITGKLVVWLQKRERKEIDS